MDVIDTPITVFNEIKENEFSANEIVFDNWNNENKINKNQLLVLNENEIMFDILKNDNKNTHVLSNAIEIGLSGSIIQVYRLVLTICIILDSFDILFNINNCFKNRDLTIVKNINNDTNYGCKNVDTSKIDFTQLNLVRAFLWECFRDHSLF